MLGAMAETAGEEPVFKVGELCHECGQLHLLLDNHLYNFQDEVDDELTCHICLQPLLQPMDTPCGHTYCFKCLENFMQEYDFCPMDRKKLSFQQCRKSSLLVRNLLDKLIVLCPFQEDCKHTMQRCELEAHLQNRCPGFKKFKAHLERKKNPRFRLKGDSVSRQEASTVKEPEILNVVSSLVSGSSIAAVVSLETPEPGLINPAFDGSEEDLPQRASLLAETSTIEIHREDPEEELGIRIVGGKDTPLGNIVVQEVLRDSVVAADGKIAPGDHILETCEARVNFVVLRQSGVQLPETVEDGSTSNTSSSSSGGSPVHHRRRPEQNHYRWKSNYQKALPQGYLSQEKVVNIKKEPKDSLGITIGGGRDSKNKLPIYVTSVQPVGCLFRDGRIKRGDVLLSINNVDLTHLNYSEAVSALKSNAALHTVTLKALEIVITENTSEFTEAPDTRENGFSWASWAPLWIMWLGLPSHLHCCQDIILHKSNSESWGFSIVGGFEENKGNQPFFIKTIVPGTPAFWDRRLKCGDEIVAVNGVSAMGMSNAELIPMLKEQRNKVTLTVVSWPGSLV
ncbi:ligand of Numb protein X 2 isoform X2 [Zootoca vivipara]|uniref:ligand of Numb protein X 2 isoform X2 n=1 Tax=Zootoca vivipara TaxID=8524 RepID=UPI00159017BA|nr:ligand of Numb protein X 2 isoform X2 [Zootoca vivipara]